MGLLVPTPTGLRKSILDAHADLRSFLKREGIHDYSEQGQGEAHKNIVTAQVLWPDQATTTHVSMYRPATKAGDPRLWIPALRGYAEAGDLIGLTVRGGNLFVINISRTDVWESRTDPQSPLGLLFTTIDREPAELQELVELLSGVAKSGFIESMRAGPTGVGFTLESLLGISANASRAPDFKGIEIKAHRLSQSGRARTRTTLLSQIPDWSISPVGNARTLLEEYGYRREEDERLQLYCTCSTAPNPQGLYLAHEEGVGTLHARAALAGEDSPREVVAWRIASLQQHLAAKHRTTAWVGAEVELKADAKESFWYSKLKVTSDPHIERLGMLINTGDITMDFTLSERESGAVRDHGYLFKIRPESTHLLFDPPIRYEFDNDQERFVRLSD